MVKNLPAMQETWVRKIPWRGNGNRLQYSYVENLMDSGPWRATVRRVAKESDTTEQTHSQLHV